MDLVVRACNFFFAGVATGTYSNLTGHTPKTHPFELVMVFAAVVATEYLADIYRELRAQR